jgi:basic amino acid/polyamine antiporter, APA family
VRESARATLAMVGVKLVVLTFFIMVALVNLHTHNFTPFAPDGFHGVTTAVAVIFFAYIGFDAVSTGSEEARNPTRDLPFAVIGSLLVCTVFYISGCSPAAPRTGCCTEAPARSPSHRPGCGTVGLAR